MRSLAFATLLGLLGAAGGCSKSSGESKSSAGEAAQPPPAAQAAQAAPIPTISVDELEARLARGDCRAVDANGDATRRRLGVIPGAVLLSDYETFIPPRELPADRSAGLVFYCANEHCGASEEAAARAITAGYTDVRVLPAGILGWKQAGKQTASL
jgi:rhodanese-related sulfurtransferase